MWQVLDGGKDDGETGPEVLVEVEGTVADVVATVADQGGVLVADVGLMQSPASLFIKATVRDIAEMVARTQGVDAQAFGGGRWYVGGKKLDTCGVGILRVPSHASRTWAEAVKALGSSDMSVAEMPDAILVRDNAQALTRIGEAVKKATEPVPSYGVEVVLCRGVSSQVRELGLSASVGAVLDVAGGWQFEHRASAGATIKAAAKMAGGSASSIVVTSVELSVVEGREVEFHLGDEVNVRTRAVSDQGTVSDVGVQSYTTGTDVTVRVRRAGAGRVEVTMEPRLSAVREFRDDLPTLSEQRLRSELVLSMDQVAVAAVFSGRADDQSSESVAGLFNLGGKRTGESQDVVVLVRVRGMRADG